MVRLRMRSSGFSSGMASGGKQRLHSGGAEVPGPAWSRAFIECVLDRRVSAALEQQPRHLHVIGLRGEVERREARAVTRAAKGGATVDVSAMVEQPAGRRESRLERGP